MSHWFSVACHLGPFVLHLWGIYESFENLYESPGTILDNLEVFWVFWRKLISFILTNWNEQKLILNSWNCVPHNSKPGWNKIFTNSKACLWPFQSHLGPFASHLRLFGSHLGPFDINLEPFSSHLHSHLDPFWNHLDHFWVLWNIFKVKC